MISALKSPNQKEKPDGVFIFYVEFLIFSKIIAPNPKSELVVNLINTLYKLEEWFCAIFTWFCSKCMNFKFLFTLGKWCVLDQHSSLVNRKDTSVVSVLSIREYFAYLKLGLAYFPLGIDATSHFVWIINFLKHFDESY